MPCLQEEDAPLPDDSSMISIFRSCSSRSFLQVRHSYRATQPVRRPHCWHLAQGLVMTVILAIPAAAKANTPITALLHDNSRCGAPRAKCFGAHWFWFSFDTPTFWFNRYRLRRGHYIDRFSFQSGYKIVGGAFYFSNGNLQIFYYAQQPGYLLFPFLQYQI